MPKVELYKKKTGFCPYCDRAVRLLEENGFHDITYIYVDESSERREEMEARCSARSVPQIFIDGEYVGGFDALSALFREGGLTRFMDK